MALIQALSSKFNQPRNKLFSVKQKCFASFFCQAILLCLERKVTCRDDTVHVLAVAYRGKYIWLLYMVLCCRTFRLSILNISATGVGGERYSFALHLNGTDVTKSGYNVNLEIYSEITKVEGSYAFVVSTSLPN